MLGCGSYKLFLRDAGGGNELAQLDFSGLSYSRLLDEMSDARVLNATPHDERCIPYLNDIRPFYHELSIWRETSEVWVGPITEVAYTYSGLTIAARDLFQWFERRLLPFDRAFVQTDLSTIAAQYVQDALSTDPSPNISTDVGPCGVMGDRVVFTLNFRRAADEIRELSRTGLDFTVIGRQIRFGGAEVPALSLPVLTSDIFETTEARLAGLQMANRVVVIGRSEGGVATPTVGIAGGEKRPLVEQTYSEATILDVTSATAAALSRIQLLSDPPVSITGKMLEVAPIDFSRLIPGAQSVFKQQVGYRFFDIPIRLHSVNVDVGIAESGHTEDIVCKLQPVGTEGENV